MILLHLGQVRSGFFKILESESGCLGLQNQAFGGIEGIAKTSFSHMLGLFRFWCHFYMVCDGFGINLMTFRALETGLKFAGF